MLVGEYYSVALSWFLLPQFFPSWSVWFQGSCQFLLCGVVHGWWCSPLLYCFALRMMVEVSSWFSSWDNCHFWFLCWRIPLWFVVFFPCMRWFCGAGVGIRVVWLPGILVGVSRSASWGGCSFVHLSHLSYLFAVSRTVVGVDLQWCWCKFRRGDGHLSFVGVCGCGVLVSIGHYSSLYSGFYSLSIVGGASECCSPHDCAGSFPFSPAS